jgi:hypothetical protein
MSAHESMKQALMDQQIPDEEAPGFGHSARHSEVARFARSSTKDIDISGEAAMLMQKLGLISRSIQRSYDEEVSSQHRALQMSHFRIDRLLLALSTFEGFLERLRAKNCISSIFEFEASLRYVLFVSSASLPG